MAAASLLGKIAPNLVLGSEVHCKCENIKSIKIRRLIAATASSSAANAPLQSLNGSSSNGITWARLALQGPRSEMEDDMEIEQCALQGGFSYAAVYDGHAGLDSVTFLKSELFHECSKALEDGALLVSDDAEILESALKQAFLQVDNRLISRLGEAGSFKDSGSTATAMFLGNKKVVVAHVGDSRVVLSRAGKAQELTADHRPYGKSKAALPEVKRIRAAGGWISNGRVCGSLAVSRAFGDIYLKTRRKEMLLEGVKLGRWTSKFASKLQLTDDWVIATPDVNFAELGDDAEFIIMATDGLWDSISSSEAVTFVRDQLKEHGESQRACEALAAAALSRNGSDNVSIIIADFRRVRREESYSDKEELASGVKQVLITGGILMLSVYLSQFS